MTTKGEASIAAATSAQRPSRRATASASAMERRITGWGALDPEPMSHGDQLVLAPGVSYALEVTLAQAASDEPAFTVRGELVLQASWAGDPDVRIVGDSPEVSVGTVPDTVIIEQFRVEVSEDARRTTGRLTVTARDRVTGRLHTIYDRTVEIAAEFRAPPPGFAAAAIRLDRKPDPRLAVLHVHGSGDQILVNGFHPSSMRLESTPIRRPSIDFVRAEQEKYSADQIVNHVLDYSQRGLRDVHAWLNEILRHLDDRMGRPAGGPLVLIIVEQIDSRVPWEMLTLEDHTVLGARAIVTRWIVISQYSRSAIELDPATFHDRRGHVLSYVDTVEVKLRALAAALKARSQEPCELLALVRQLAAQPDGLALVMLTCHGIFVGDPGSEGQYGSRQGNHNRITRRDLVGIATSVGPRPLVFVNACHSARLSGSEHNTAGLPIGLPEVFLRGYARGYLGTIGAVSLDFAAELGTCILDAASTSTGVCIPELLFERRRKAAANRANDAKTFVDTFMYVFYGAPYDRLMLDAGIPPGGVHE